MPKGSATPQVTAADVQNKDIPLLGYDASAPAGSNFVRVPKDAIATARIFTGATPPANPQLGDYWFDGTEQWVYRSLVLLNGGTYTNTNVWCLPLNFNQGCWWGSSLNVHFDLYQGRTPSRVVLDTLSFRGRFAKNDATNYWRFLQYSLRGDTDYYQSEVSSQGKGTGFLNLINPVRVEITHNQPALSGLMIQTLPVGAPGTLNGGLFAKCWYVRP